MNHHIHNFFSRVCLASLKKISNPEEELGSSSNLLRIFVHFEYHVQHFPEHNCEQTREKDITFDFSLLPEPTFIPNLLHEFLGIEDPQLQRNIKNKISFCVRKNIDKYMKLGSKDVPINVKIKGVHRSWECERCLMESGIRQSMVEFDSVNYGMVPATDSSIKTMLRNVKVGDRNEDLVLDRKRKRHDDDLSLESCRVCLEEFWPKTIVACMPCLHAFHGDCIVGWLKRSHYCPICRFQMPTH